MDAIYNFTKTNREPKLDEHGNKIFEPNKVENLTEPVNATEKLQVFNEPYEEFLKNNEFNHVYGDEKSDYKKKLALGAILKYRDLLHVEPENLYNSSLVSNSNSNRLYIAINSDEVEWSLLEIRKKKKWSISSNQDTQRLFDASPSNKYLHLSMHTSKEWKVEKDVKKEVQQDNLKNCELDLKSLLGALNPKTKLLVRWIHTPNEWEDQNITETIPISLWPKIYLKNWSFSKFDIKLDTSMTVARVEFDMKLKRTSQENNSESIFIMPLFQSLVTDISMTKNGCPYQFESDIERCNINDKSQGTTLFDFLKIDLSAIEDNCDDLSINVKFVSVVRINEDLTENDGPDKDQKDGQDQLKFEFKYYLRGIDENIISLTSSPSTHSSIEKERLVSSRTYTISSNDETLKKSRNTVKWCELLASYDAQQRQVNCEARYFFNEKYIFPWDKNLVDKKVELHLMIENSDQSMIHDGPYKKSTNGPTKLCKGLFNQIETLITHGHKGIDGVTHKPLTELRNTEWCIHTLGQKVESSNGGTPAELDNISGYRYKMTDAASCNIGQSPDNIPFLTQEVRKFLSKPVREEYYRVIVLVAQTEELMDKIRELNNDADTRVHTFIFHKSDRQLEPLKKLKQKYGVFPNYSDYGELQEASFSRRLIR